MTELTNPRTDRERQVAASAWFVAVEAVAWASDNGSDPLSYVRDHNPYRPASGLEGSPSEPDRYRGNRSQDISWVGAPDICGKPMEDPAREPDLRRRVLELEATLGALRDWIGNADFGTAQDEAEMFAILGYTEDGKSPFQALEARERQVAADGWSTGVAIALNHAIRNDDGVTLRLEHLDGRPWANPYIDPREGRA